MKKAFSCFLILSLLIISIVFPAAVWAEEEANDTDSKPAQTQEQEKTTEKENAAETKDDSKNESTSKKKATNNNRNYNRSYNYYSQSANNVDDGVISIIFTHDMYSHIDASGSKKTGGAAKMVTAFKEISRSFTEDTYVLDAGNFTGDTILNCIFDTDAPEIRLMGYMGFDATTLGANEYIFGEEKLIDMLKAAKKSGEDIPSVLIGNASEKGFKGTGAKTGFKVLEKNSTKIAVFAIADEKTADGYSDPVSYAKEQIKKIKKKKDIDLVVCLSESSNGTFAEELADEVSGIDLIIAAGTGNKLKSPEKKGKTLIVSSGKNSKNIGHITFKENDKGKYKFDEYEIKKLDPSVSEDGQTKSYVSGLKKLVDTKYFGKFGYGSSDYLTKNNIDFKKSDTFGNLVSDAFAYKEDSIGVASDDSVSGVLPKGKIKVSDVYEIAADDDPLVKIYLTGKELKSLAEADASLTDIDLSLSGIEYTVNTKRINMNRAVDIYLADGEKIENKKLYSVVGDLAAVKKIAKVDDKTNGILSIVPKDEEGNVLIDYDNCVIKRNKRDLTVWAALSDYLKSIKTLDKAYAKDDGRVKVIESGNIKELLKQPNRAGWLLRLAIIVPVLMILIIVLIVFIRRHRRDKNMMFKISERQKKAIFAPSKKQRKIFSGRRRRRYNRRGRYR